MKGEQKESQNGIEPLHSLFDLGLVDFDTHNESSCLILNIKLFHCKKKKKVSSHKSQ